MSDIVVDEAEPLDTLFPTFSPTLDPLEDQDFTLPPTDKSGTPTDLPNDEDGTPTPTTFPTRDGTPTPTESISTLPPTRTFMPTYITTTMPPEDEEQAGPPEDEEQAVQEIIETEKEVLEAAEEAAKAVTEPPTAADSEEDSFSQTKERPPTDPPTDPPTNPPTPPPTLLPTLPPTPAPTLRPTNPDATIKQDVFNGHFVGFQSDWGPAYPGSMTYDFTRNSIYMTGTTFRDDKTSDYQRSSCFMGELPVADIENWSADHPPLPPLTPNDFVQTLNTENYFKVPERFDERQMMACHAVFVNDEPQSGNIELYVGGVSEADATKRNGDIAPVMNTYGRTRFEPNWKISRPPLKIESQEQALNAKVRWPVAMASGWDGINQMDSLIVLVIDSDDGLMTEEYIENHDAHNAKNFKNTLLPPGREGADPSKYAVPKRGSNYYFSWHVFHQDEQKNAPPLYYGGSDVVEVVREGSSVLPAGMANLKPAGQEYTIVGTIKGKAPRVMFMNDPKNSDETPRLDDYDGFATRLDFGMRTNFNRDMNVRFASVEESPPLDDFVHGMCTPPPNPASGEIKSYYVVGSTYGTMPPGNDQTQITTNILKGNDVLKDGNSEQRLSAWISKVDVRNKNQRQIVWTTQLFDTVDGRSFEGGMTEAYGCSVVDIDKSKVYVAGTVYNGGIMDTSEASKGGDDVWVAQLNSTDGSIRWLRQIGSKGDDKLARSNGIVSDSHGHAIVFGETNGEMYRDRSGEKLGKDDGSSTDIFVTTLDVMTGNSEPTVETDRGARDKALTGILTTVTLVLVCFVVGLILKWRRAQKYAAKAADGVLKTNGNGLFKDRDGSMGKPSYADDMQDNIAPQALSEAPPTEAFSDTAQNFNASGTFTETSNGGTTNGDSSVDNKIV